MKFKCFTCFNFHPQIPQSKILLGPITSVGILTMFLFCSLFILLLLVSGSLYTYIYTHPRYYLSKCVSVSKFVCRFVGIGDFEN